MFKPLKDAIANVIFNYDDVDDEFAVVRREDLRILKLTYNEFFVEPEDDDEWKEWQSS
jgi:hypothetical protein